MVLYITGLIFTLTAIGFSIVDCKGRHEKEYRQDTSVSCYECNSEYDPRCGDPFDNYTIGVVNCSLKQPLDHIIDIKPTFCRKTVQKVNNKIRVIRGCGYIPDDARYDKTCMKRSGTHDVQVIYCTCKGNICNIGHFQTRPSFNIIFIEILLAIITNFVKTA